MVPLAPYNSRQTSSVFPNKQRRGRSWGAVSRLPPHTAAGLASPPRRVPTTSPVPHRPIAAPIAPVSCLPSRRRPSSHLASLCRPSPSVALPPHAAPAALGVTLCPAPPATPTHSRRGPSVIAATQRLGRRPRPHPATPERGPSLTVDVASPHPLAPWPRCHSYPVAALATGAPPPMQVRGSAATAANGGRLLPRGMLALPRAAAQAHVGTPLPAAGRAFFLKKKNLPFVI